jgi:hypothetical protein
METVWQSIRGNSSMMVSRDVKGFPRQLMEMKGNSRCSLLFHLLVAGGRWQMVMARPVSEAWYELPFLVCEIRIAI